MKVINFGLNFWCPSLKRN